MKIRLINADIWFLTYRKNKCIFLKLIQIKISNDPSVSKVQKIQMVRFRNILFIRRLFHDINAKYVKTCVHLTKITV